MLGISCIPSNGISLSDSPIKQYALAWRSRRAGFVGQWQGTVEPHPVQNTSVGMVSGNTLTIEAALAGIYRLTFAGDTFAGSYTRGTTFSGKAEFRRL